MNRCGSFLPYLLAAVVLVGGWGAPVVAKDSVVDREVNGLMAALRDSGCEFNRNGTWYDGKRAASHLRRKYDHVRERTPLPDTETFIELAASRSSISGKAYLVRCGDAKPMESRSWFLARLGILRGPSGKPLAPSDP